MFMGYLKLNQSTRGDLLRLYPETHETQLQVLKS